MAKLIFAVLAGLAIITMTRADVPCICTKEMKPVCGTDSVTYSNLCELRCAKRTRTELDLAYDGRCEEGIPAIPLNDEKSSELGRCFCTRETNLVCGSNGKTYSNPCELKCAQRMKSDITLAHYGSCADVASNIISQ